MVTKTLDSSAVFRQENFRGVIREVSLMGPPEFRDTILDHVFDETKSQGYRPVKNVIVNISHGASSKNEPVPAILMEGSKGEEGIIITRYLSPHAQEHRFYTDGWKYIS